jgi:hypothetical protein
VKPKVTKVDVWAATMQDRAGGLAKKLAPLAAAGANLEFIVARRSPDKPGEGVVFVTPLKGAKQVKAAKEAGFHTTDTLHSVRVEGGDKPGLGAKATQALAEAGISLRGLSAAAFGRKFVCYLALDSAADATKAISVVKRLS